MNVAADFINAALSNLICVDVRAFAVSILIENFDVFRSQPGIKPFIEMYFCRQVWKFDLFWRFFRAT